MIHRAVHPEDGAAPTKGARQLKVRDSSKTIFLFLAPDDEVEILKKS